MNGTFNVRGYPGGPESLAPIWMDTIEPHCHKPLRIGQRPVRVSPTPQQTREGAGRSERRQNARAISRHVRAVDSASAGCSKTISREIVGKKAQCAREAMKLHRRRAMYVAAISETRAAESPKNNDAKSRSCIEDAQCCGSY